MCEILLARSYGVFKAHELNMVIYFRIANPKVLQVPDYKSGLTFYVCWFEFAITLRNKKRPFSQAPFY